MAAAEGKIKLPFCVGYYLCVMPLVAVADDCLTFGLSPVLSKFL